MAVCLLFPLVYLHYCDDADDTYDTSMASFISTLLSHRPPDARPPAYTCTLSAYSASQLLLFGYYALTTSGRRSIVDATERGQLSIQLS